MTNKHSHREIGRAVFLAAIMLLSTVAVSAAFTGGAVAQDSTLQGDRTVENNVLTPGESTQVTTEVTVDSQTDVNLIDQFSPKFESVDIVNVNPGNGFSGNNTAELFVTESGVSAGTTVSVTYEVTVPNDADGESFEISSDSDGGNVNAGTDTIDVVSSDTLSGDRSIGSTELEPGQSAEVTTEVTVDSQTDVNLIDQFSPKFESVDIVNVNPGNGFSGNNTAELFVTESGVSAGTTVSVTYEVTVASGDSAVGSTYKISSDSEGGNVEAGTDTISVVEDATQPATFEVSNLDPADTTVSPGADLTVSAGVENTGDEDGMQDVEFLVDGNAVANKTVQLDAGNSTTVEFDVSAPSQPGDYTHAIASANDTAEGNLTVESQPATFEVSNLDPADTTVTQGNNLTVSANVTNSGNLAAEKSVSLSVENASGAVTELATQTVNLNPGDTVKVTFELEDVQLDAGDYSHIISTEDDSTDGNLTIDEADDSPTLEDYQQIGDGPSDQVTIEGLRAAIDDFVNTEIEIGLLRDVINDFTS